MAVEMTGLASGAASGIAHQTGAVLARVAAKAAVLLLPDGPVFPARQSIVIDDGDIPSGCAPVGWKGL